MKKTFLCCVLMLFIFCMFSGTSSADTTEPLVVTGENGNAYLFSIDDAMYLVGAATPTGILAQYPDVQIGYVVLVCDHQEHIDAAVALAEDIGAAVIYPKGESMALTWQENGLLICDYAFSAEEPVDGYYTLDCQGCFLSFEAKTTTGSVNVRSTPTIKGKRVEKLSKGAVVTVIGQETNDAGELWYRVVLANGEEGYIRADLLSVGTAVAAAVTPAPAEGGNDTRYVGNKSSKVFHRPGCEHLPKGKNAVYFSSRSYAIAKGYRPCEHCDP